MSTGIETRLLLAISCSAFQNSPSKVTEVSCPARLMERLIIGESFWRRFLRTGLLVDENVGRASMMMPPKRVSLVSRGDDATALLGILGPACMPLLATGRLSATTAMSARVKSRHLRRNRSCPPYPQQRTCAVQRGMSASAKSELMRRSKKDLYSITSSARSRNVSGILRLSALAALRLMTSRYVVGC